MEFVNLLKKQLIKESGHYYTHNYDYHAKGKKRPFKKKAINFFKLIFYSKPILGTLLSSDYFYRKIFLGKMYGMNKYMDRLQFFYNKLEDQKSKDLLLKLMAFKILGYVKVKMPLSTPKFWAELDELTKLRDEENFISINSKPWKLYFHDLTKIGYPAKVYLHTSALHATFHLNQYENIINDTYSIGVREGDTVLDLGGCYGDTALYFADKAGKNGKVYSFEFIPGNAEIFKKNLEFNPDLKDNITIVGNPVWSESSKKVYYTDKSTSSRISFEEYEGYEGITETLTVDDFCKKYNVDKVDFIKTDIESAEPYAIRGAIETLKKHKPRLGISIYHGMEDFVNIIKQIDDLNLGYKFYIDHATIYSSETVLFCEA